MEQLLNAALARATPDPSLCFEHFNVPFPSFLKKKTTLIQFLTVRRLFLGLGSGLGRGLWLVTCFTSSCVTSVLKSQQFLSPNYGRKPMELQEDCVKALSPKVAGSSPVFEGLVFQNTAGQRIEVSSEVFRDFLLTI